MLPPSKAISGGWERNKFIIRRKHWLCLSCRLIIVWQVSRSSQGAYFWRSHIEDLELRTQSHSAEGKLHLQYADKGKGNLVHQRHTTKAHLMSDYPWTSLDLHLAQDRALQDHFIIFISVTFSVLRNLFLKINNLRLYPFWAISLLQGLEQTCNYLRVQWLRCSELLAYLLLEYSRY